MFLMRPVFSRCCSLHIAMQGIVGCNGFKGKGLPNGALLQISRHPVWIPPEWMFNTSGTKLEAWADRDLAYLSALCVTFGYNPKTREWREQNADTQSFDGDLRLHGNRCQTRGGGGWGGVLQ